MRGFKNDVAILGDDLTPEISSKAGTVELWKDSKQTNSALILQTREEVEKYVLSVVTGYFLTTKKASVNLESEFKDHGLDSLDIIELII